ncbi:MAG: radical SAM protein [Spirochaetales bacterium]|nr:radical SAM protein [Spirochaetales bacterium]
MIPEIVRKSLLTIDENYPRPEIIEVLLKKENSHLLQYVQSDPFGAHIFPGNITDYPLEQFLHDLNEQLKNHLPIHLWITIPLCRSRCHYCQSPVVTVTADDPTSLYEDAMTWVNLNIKEARLWLAKVPVLREVPVGEFNIFGGTPSLLPAEAIGRLLAFYKSNFNFTENTTLRFEGNPDSLTGELLAFLHQTGITKLSCGIQSFDNTILRLAGRNHTGEIAEKSIESAQKTGFDWISADFIYGMLNQTVAGFEKDIRKAIKLGLDGIVCTKLHLRTFSEIRTGVSGVHPALWQDMKYRNKMKEKGYHWPTLGEQFQMREILVRLLDKHYTEHPAMYFGCNDKGYEKWKSFMVDQDKQRAEVAIGLGGSSSCRLSEATTLVDPESYYHAIENGCLPLEKVQGFDPLHKEIRSVKMALSSCMPLKESQHCINFENSSLFADYWYSKFRSLEQRGFVHIDNDNKQIIVTPNGRTLVEAIINTELY